MEEEMSSNKNITDKWLDNIFETLMRLEGYERLAKEGCNSILEYVQVQNLDLATIQHKNYEMFISEFEIILNNTRHLIDKKTYLQITLKLNALKNFEQEVGGFLDVKFNQMQHTEHCVLKQEFYFAENEISKLRGILVSSLWKYLSPNSKESFEGLPR